MIFDNLLDVKGYCFSKLLQRQARKQRENTCFYSLKRGYKKTCPKYRAGHTLKI